MQREEAEDVVRGEDRTSWRRRSRSRLEHIAKVSMRPHCATQSEMPKSQLGAKFEPEQPL